MFDLTTTNEVQTMTSREIAKLVESRHDNVKRAIERLADKGIIRIPPTEVSEEINNLGLKVMREHYLFRGPEGKRDSIVVVAQLCPEFTARLVDRWQELEQKQQAPALNLNDPKQLLGLLQNYAERTLELENKVVVQGTVIAVQEEQIHNMHNLFHEGMTPPAFVKQLNGCNASAISGYLEEIGWVYSRERKGGKDWYVYAGIRDKFLRQTSYCHNVGYHQIRVSTVQLTKQGAVKLYEMYLDGKLPMKKGWDGKFTHDVI